MPKVVEVIPTSGMPPDVKRAIEQINKQLAALQRQINDLRRIATS